MAQDADSGFATAEWLMVHDDSVLTSADRAAPERLRSSEDYREFSDGLDRELAELMGSRVRLARESPSSSPGNGP